MPREATYSSFLKVSSQSFAQSAIGAWKPNAITWSEIVGVPCRVFPAREGEVKSTWGEALKFDVVVWVNPSDVVGLPVETLTSGSGVQVPVQIVDSNGKAIEYMAVSARNLANFGKVLAIALRRFSHG